MLSKAKIASAQQQGDFLIKPETVQPVLSTSEWPLLLKNYDKLLIRSSHFTPIPSGCSPLKRDIASYIKWAFTMISIRVLTVIYRQVGRYQPRQTVQPFFSRSCRMAQTNLAR
jgi:hypothetical protein